MEAKPLHIVMALAAAFIALFAATQLMAPKPVAPDYAMQARDLYMEAASFGENASAYIYAYGEYSNGFAENYTLACYGKAASVDVASVLSDKKLYFLENDTVLCVRFAADEACSSVKNESAAKSYVARMRSRLFNSTAMGSMKNDYEYMINRSVLVFSPYFQAMVLADGRECTEIRYAIDYRNMTLQDMGRFGISAGTPQVFQYVSCIGQDGDIDQLYYNYTYQGKLYTIQQKLIGADFTAAPVIGPPQNLSGNALDIAFNENAYRQDLFSKCYLGQDEGEGRGACIQKIALQLGDKNLCELAGAVHDRCLVSFMPYLKDPAICALITTPEFADDCYIELAGANKNSTWCGNVLDGTKKGYCLQVALPVPPSPPENESPGTANETTGGAMQNQSANESAALPPGVSAIFNGMEASDSANSTGPADSTGSANGTG